MLPPAAEWVGENENGRRESMEIDERSVNRVYSDEREARQTAAELGKRLARLAPLSRWLIVSDWEASVLADRFGWELES
jgi:hypothetical protein